MEHATPYIVDVGPNVVTIALAIITAVASIVAAVHASEARANSAANLIELRKARLPHPK